MLHLHLLIQVDVLKCLCLVDAFLDFLEVPLQPLSDRGLQALGNVFSLSSFSSYSQAFQATCPSKICSGGVPLTSQVVLLDRNENSSGLRFSPIWPTSGSQKHSLNLYLDKFWDWRQISKQLLLCCQSSWLVPLAFQMFQADVSQSFVCAILLTNSPFGPAEAPLSDLR